LSTVLSLIKPEDMDIYRGVEVKLHAFLTSATYGDEAPNCFTVAEISPRHAA
jgi:hypothetical protein